MERKKRLQEIFLSAQAENMRLRKKLEIAYLVASSESITAKEISDKIKSAGKNIWEWLKKIFKAIVDFLTKMINKISNFLKNASIFFQKIKRFIKISNKTFVEKFEISSMEVVDRILSELNRVAKQITPESIGEAKEFVDDFVRTMRSVYKKKNEIRDTLNKIDNDLQGIESRDPKYIYTVEYKQSNARYNDYKLERSSKQLGSVNSKNIVVRMIDDMEKRKNSLQDFIDKYIKVAITRYRYMYEALKNKEVDTKGDNILDTVLNKLTSIEYTKTLKERLPLINGFINSITKNTTRLSIIITKDIKTINDRLIATEDDYNMVTSWDKIRKK